MELIAGISLIQWVYYLLATLALTGALGTILSKKPMYSIIFLILTFFALSGIYVLLNAQFLAVVNIIVYAGAIMVLFLFVIMFLNLREESNELNNKATVISAVVVGALLFVILFSVISKADVVTDLSSYKASTGLIETLGLLLYKHYILAFEIVSVLFLVGIVGAILLGKREKGARHF